MICLPTQVFRSLEPELLRSLLGHNMQTSTTLCRNDEQEFKVCPSPASDCLAKVSKQAALMSQGHQNVKPLQPNGPLPRVQGPQQELRALGDGKQSYRSL